MDEELLGDGGHGRDRSRDERRDGRRDGRLSSVGRRSVAALLTMVMIAVLLPMTAASPAAAQTGAITRLPAEFVPQEINNQGAIAGYVGGDVVIYENGEFTNLGSPGGGGIIDFNDQGEVLLNNNAGQLRVLSVNGAVTYPIPVNDGIERPIQKAWGPDPDGRVVGTHNWVQSTQTNAVQYQGASPPSVITQISTVMAVSRSGAMVGQLTGTPRQFGVIDGTGFRQVSLGQDVFGVRMLNDAGQMVVNLQRGVAFYDNGTVTPINDISVYDMNGEGVIAGSAGRAAAVRLPDGTVRMILDELGPNTGWSQLDEARRVNGQCQVFGSGTFGEERFQWYTATLPDCEPPPEVTATVEVAPGPHRIGEPVEVVVRVTNAGDSPMENFLLLGGTGLVSDPDKWELTAGPNPPAPTVLGANSTTEHRLNITPLDSGPIPLTGGGSGTVNGSPLTAQASGNLQVLPNVTVAFSTTVTEATVVGEDFDVIATVTNDEEVEVANVKAEGLTVNPASAVALTAGPLNEAGEDPRIDPITVPAGGSATIRWTYTAVEQGTVSFSGSVSGTDPYAGSVFFVDGSTTAAIEAPGLEVTNFRMQPGSPTPGTFGNLRGTITNVGSVEVTGIDFESESSPRTVIVETRIDEAGEVSPRIATLAPGESREFLIPFGMVLDAGELGAFTVDLTMTGTAQVGGEDVEVSVDALAAGPLDLTRYWTNIFDDIGRQLRDGFFQFFEGTNDWAESSTIGGVAVGSTEGVLTAFQKMGDGILGTGELIVTENGRTRLTNTGKQVVGAIREYVSRATLKKMFIDFADVRDDATTGGVGIFADWMYDVDTAATEGDFRKVSALITEPAALFATGVGVEVAAGQLFTKFLSTSVGRKGVSYLKAGSKAPVEGPGTNYSRLYDGQGADLKDMPVGVPVSGQVVAKAGLTLDEHAWMIEMAKEHGIAFFARPRPANAAKYARLGYNAKPMPIKFKSVNDIDVKWLGYDDYADSKGVVVVREPVDPLDAMKAAVDSDELEWGGKEIDDIIERYNVRRAEYEQLDTVIAELNAKNGGEGFDIQRYGKTIRTKVTVDPGGQLRMTWNNKPIFSDIDLLAIARPDGSEIDPLLHKRITEAAGFGIDGQHGDSALTSDFPNWKKAEEVAVPYIFEHQRGGDPLVIVQPDVTTLGYVDQVTLPAEPPGGSGYDLYGAIKVTYEGAGSR